MISARRRGGVGRAPLDAASTASRTRLTDSLPTQAPWMVRQVDEDAVAAARAMRGYEKRRERIALEEKQGTINILDAASSELTGLGLKAKVLSEDEVELTWSTDDEEANRGFLVERKAVPTSA